jgi:hypothetical protein
MTSATSDLSRQRSSHSTNNDGDRVEAGVTEDE